MPLTQASFRVRLYSVSVLGQFSRLTGRILDAAVTAQLAVTEASQTDGPVVVAQRVAALAKVVVDRMPAPPAVSPNSFHPGIVRGH